MTYTEMRMACAMLLLAGSALAAEAPKAVAGSAATPAAGPAQANVQVAMLAQINAQGTALWDITNEAMDKAPVGGEPKLRAADWTKLLAIGKSLEEGARALATAKTIVSAPPGAKIADEGPPGVAKAADVQRYIDADTATFRNRAARLQQTGASLVAAAKARDNKVVFDLANHLDAVCEECHKQFWYPQKKK